ncbi:MAG: metallophosphoesterase family protein [Planctomycetota bacterium]
MARYAIGDIHGCAKALRTLIQSIEPGTDDELIFMGDYVDRGPDSRDVIEQLIELKARCRVVALRGNHEVMLVGVALGGCDPEAWLRSGGAATVASYGGATSKIPSRHLEFLESLVPAYQTETEIFVHAMYDPECDVHEQSDELTYWTHLPVPLPPPHGSGRRVYLGHTPQASGDVLFRPHLVCVDTYCFGGGYLTALDLTTERVVQVNRHGHVRKVPFMRMVGGLAACGRWFARGRIGSRL